MKHLIAILLSVCVSSIAIAQPQRIERNVARSKATLPLAIVEPSWKDGELVTTQGRATKGDGGAAEYIFHNTGWSALSKTDYGGHYVRIGASDAYLEMVDKTVANVLHYGAVGDGSTDNTTALNNAIDELESEGGGILLIPDAGTFNVEGTITSNANVTWKFEGGIVDVQAGSSVTINGGVTNSSNQQCFAVPAAASEAASLLKIRDASQTNLCSPYVRSVSPFWFDGSDIGAKINKCFQVCAGRCEVQLPPGKFPLSTRIDMGEAFGLNFVLRGTGVNGSVLEITSGADIVGIDMGAARECTVSNLRVIEVEGSRSSCCMQLAGQTNTIDKVWLGNAKYGIVHNQGSGLKVSNLVIEACDYGILVGSAFADWTITGLDVVGSVVQDSVYTNIDIFDCGAFDGVSEDACGLKISGYKNLTLTSTSGTFQDGEAFTTSGGGAGTIHNTNGLSQISSDKLTQSGTIATSQTITGTTSGATATISTITDWTVRDVQFIGCRVRQNTRHGAVIAYADYCSFNGLACMFNGSEGVGTAYGFWLRDECKSVSFSQCIFRNNRPVYDAGPPAKFGVGMTIDGATNVVTISDCAFGNQTSGSPEQRKGLVVDDADSVIVSNTMFRNCAFDLEDNSAAGAVVVKDSYGVDAQNVAERINEQSVAPMLPAGFGEVWFAADGTVRVTRNSSIAGAETTNISEALADAQYSDAWLAEFNGTTSKVVTGEQFTLEASEISIYATLRTDTLSGTQTIVSQGGYSLDGGGGWALTIEDTGKLAVWMLQDASGSYHFRQRTTSAVITAGQYHDIRVTIDNQTTPMIGIVVDGVSQSLSTVNALTGTYGDAALDCVIGGRGISAVNPFNGSLGLLTVTDGSTTYTSGNRPETWPGVTYGLRAELVPNRKFEGSAFDFGFNPLRLIERSADEPNPLEGQAAIWQSDGTGTGDDGDVIMKVTAASTTTTHYLTERAPLGHAQISIEDNATATTVSSTQSDWSAKSQFVGFGTNFSDSSNATPDHTNDHITLTSAGTWEVCCVVTLSGSVVSDLWELALWKNNGATQVSTKQGVNIRGAGLTYEKQVTISGLVDASANDTIELWVQRTNGTGTLTITNAVMTAKKVSD